MEYRKLMIQADDDEQQQMPRDDDDNKEERREWLKELKVSGCDG
jgi:hypothetical protein